MSKLYTVMVTFNVGPVHPPLIEGVLGVYGDWLRINPGAWLLSSAHNARDIADHISRAMSVGDHVLVAAVAVEEYWGTAPTWVWSWIEERKQRQISMSQLPKVPYAP